MSIIRSLTGAVKTASLTHPFTTAKHTVNTMQSVYVTITLADGHIGHGAATPNEVVTGDTLTTCLAVVNDVLAPALQGADLDDFNTVIAQVHAAITGNTPAKAAVEIALYDLRAQLLGVPLTGLLGARVQPVETDYTLGIADTNTMIQAAQAHVAAGFKALKIKLGTLPLEADLARIQAIAAAVGPAIRLRLDANQAWSAKAALNAVAAFSQADLPIDFIEQPVAAADLTGLAAVTKASKLPIMADESVHTFRDAQALIQAQACDLVNIKLMKTAGLSEALKINALCEANGIACMVGCMIESQVSLAAAAALVASQANIKFVDLDAVFMSNEDLAVPYLTLDHDQILLNQAPGL
ncbi:dipeptide epimerase [Lacticaseibacillus baoqingensis]|uniref:Dipeptide epimerase n=1 Tax=Lacticaseibacillus baoqingensis TaxID=2486013 RepID=A0ABW4E900_9LACO|nr:dipeptide epimerase [Lacticaseibacillus baoqingensis]